MGPSKCPYSMNTTPSSSNKMTLTTQQMNFNKQQLANAYVTHLVENMDLSDLMSYAYDHIQKHLEDYTVEELVAEVEDSAPDVLADLVEEIGATK